MIRIFNIDTNHCKSSRDCKSVTTTLYSNLSYLKTFQTEKGMCQGRSQGGADGAAAPPWHVTAPPWWGSGAEVGQPVFWSTQKII